MERKRKGGGKRETRRRDGGKCPDSCTLPILAVAPGPVPVSAQPARRRFFSHLVSLLGLPPYFRGGRNKSPLLPPGERNNLMGSRPFGFSLNFFIFFFASASHPPLSSNRIGFPCPFNPLIPVPQVPTIQMRALGSPFRSFFSLPANSPATACCRPNPWALSAKRVGPNGPISTSTFPRPLLSPCGNSHPVAVHP